jgi:diamine N-acetyltransferase
MSVITRFATTEDAMLIAAISRQTFYDSFAEQNTVENVKKHMDEYYAVPKIQEELADALNMFILVYDGQTLAGYCKLTEQTKPEAKQLQNPVEIERIYAVKESIGKGIGKTLMQQCINTAIKKGKSSLWLGVWEHNQRAIDFYIKWGFEKFGEHIFVVGDDPQTDWLMKKTI